MTNPIIRAISPLAAISPFAAAVDDVSDIVDAVEGFYTPYSPYPQHYAVRDPNMRDAVRLAALGLIPADLAPQPSPFTRVPTRVPSSVNKDKLEALKTSVLTKLKLLPKDILPVNLDNTSNSTPVPVKDTVEQNLGNHLKQPIPITDATKAEEYIKKMYAKQAKLNRELAAFNNVQNNQASIQGDTTPEKKEKPVTGINTSKNPLGDSVKKAVNQNAKKDTGSARVDVNPETIQPVLTPEEIGNYYATYGAKKSVPNPKTALNESQSDYYRYLTGYRRMDPNQAILSMGLDPNKYYYQHDPAYYH